MQIFFLSEGSSYIKTVIQWLQNPFLVETQLGLFRAWFLYTSILQLYLFLFYAVAVIEFNQTAYTFEEGDGTVEVCAVFLQPSQIAPNVVVELMGSTSLDTADG